MVQAKSDFGAIRIMESEVFTTLKERSFLHSSDALINGAQFSGDKKSPTLYAGLRFIGIASQFILKTSEVSALSENISSSPNRQIHALQYSCIEPSYSSLRH